MKKQKERDPSILYTLSALSLCIYSYCGNLSDEETEYTETEQGKTSDKTESGDKVEKNAY